MRLCCHTAAGDPANERADVSPRSDIRSAVFGWSRRRPDVVLADLPLQKRLQDFLGESASVDERGRVEQRSTGQEQAAERSRCWIVLRCSRSCRCWNTLGMRTMATHTEMRTARMEPRSMRQREASTPRRRHTTKRTRRRRPPHRRRRSHLSFSLLFAPIAVPLLLARSRTTDLYLSSAHPLYSSN